MSYSFRLRIKRIDIDDEKKEHEKNIKEMFL